MRRLARCLLILRRAKPRQLDSPEGGGGVVVEGVEGPAEVQGLARALAAMATDLSQLIGREQTARREAEAANRSKDQFLAMLSHELRTPLTAVLGWAHTLRHAPHDPERVERAASAIERSAESQRRLIEDLLDVTGIAAGRVRINGLFRHGWLIAPAVVEDALRACGLSAAQPAKELAQ